MCPHAACWAAQAGRAGTCNDSILGHACGSAQLDHERRDVQDGHLEVPAAGAAVSAVRRPLCVRFSAAAGTSAANLNSRLAGGRRAQVRSCAPSSTGRTCTGPSAACGCWPRQLAEAMQAPAGGLQAPARAACAAALGAASTALAVAQGCLQGRGPRPAPLAAPRPAQGSLASTGCAGAALPVPLSLLVARPLAPPARGPLPSDGR